MTDEVGTNDGVSPVEAIEAVRTLIRWIGDNPNRSGLQDTPIRVLKAWRDSWGSGYDEPDQNLIRLFDSDEISISTSPAAMVVVSGIRFFSTCEHHMAPFFGEATIAYIPAPRTFKRAGGRLGLSKFARIVDLFARRLQVQERLTDQIADFIVEHVSPDVAVLMRATHTCMSSRGVNQPEARTTTSALRGDFNVPTTRAEFYACANEQR